MRWKLISCRDSRSHRTDLAEPKVVVVTAEKHAVWAPLRRCRSGRVRGIDGDRQEYGDHAAEGDDQDEGQDGPLQGEATGHAHHVLSLCASRRR